ncbi:MAG: site-2 protease family protein, partial [Nitrospinae bacterium]|nr:site-2 protease family protein [Nitrospinota bacterium]
VYINILLFIATLCTTFIAGRILFTTVIEGILFSFTLILILGTHEIGHYYMSKKWGIKATLPFFIPAPPPFLAGTFGAFIRIKSPIPNRRVLFDIGIGGPLAGFLVAVPAVIIGLKLSEVREASTFKGLYLGTSLIISFLTRVVLGISSESSAIYLHPVAFAGWIGLFVTTLNLLPTGQLDGGHIIYSLASRRHMFFSKLVFWILIPFGIFYWQGWLIWALIIFFFGFRHPPLMDEVTPLYKWQKVLGVISIIILIITFTPTPFKLLQ